MEFCPRGSLSNYISGKKGVPLSESEMFKFVYGALEGMVALATDGLVHRDLAARNILLDENLFIKVSDFGSSRQSNQADQQKGKPDDTLGPIKWQPPEVLNNQAYSEKSDVWSFGCTLIEIVTGREPYSGYAGNILQLMQQIKDGSINPLLHFEKTGDTSELPTWVAPVLPSCFLANPSSRPTFREIRFQINKRARNLLNAYETELDELESVLSPQHYTPVPAAPWTGAKPSTQRSKEDSFDQKAVLDIKSLERLSKLGAGAFGTVFLGKFQGQYVAIKVLDLSSSSGPTILREVEVMSSVPQHRNIVQLIGVARAGDQIDIVMEFAPKGSCDDYVSSSDGKISEALLFKWALGIARGMAHLTASKVIHRDLRNPRLLILVWVAPFWILSKKH
jgi:serine/threonine protein kinase